VGFVTAELIAAARLSIRLSREDPTTEPWEKTLVTQLEQMTDAFEATS
jgi:hypothetical protein